VHARIHLFGASGSGTTTLGSTLADELSIPHLDTDYYYWRRTDPPFIERNAPDRRIRLLRLDTHNENSWILSGSLCGWGDEILGDFTLAVFCYLDQSIRMRRLAEREWRRYGARITPDGNMHQQHHEFMVWAESYDSAKAPTRSFDLHESWMKRLSCPVLRLDSNQPIEVLVREVLGAAA
jgi:adenylate kinase family enzyme